MLSTNYWQKQVQTMQKLLNDKKIDGKGKGTTKKEADQHAAYEALKKYGIEK